MGDKIKCVTSRAGLFTDYAGYAVPLPIEKQPSPPDANGPGTKTRHPEHQVWIIMTASGPELVNQ
jgi:hypothetical protein